MFPFVWFKSFSQGMFRASVASEFQQEVYAGYLTPQRCDRHVQPTDIARRAQRPDRVFAVRNALTSFQDASQRPDQVDWLVEKIREWPTAHLIDAEGEYVLRDPVRINDAELGVEQDDADRERVEQIRGLEMGEDRGRRVVLRRQGPLRVCPLRERPRESNSVRAKGGLQCAPCFGVFNRPAPHSETRTSQAGHSSQLFCAGDVGGSAEVL
jgi:hypothetical protein